MRVLLISDDNQTTTLPIKVSMTCTDLLLTNRYDGSEIISIPFSDPSLKKIEPPPIPKTTNESCPKCKKLSDSMAQIPKYVDYNSSLFLCDECYSKQTKCCTCYKEISAFSSHSNFCSDCRRLFCYPKHIKGCAGCGDTYCNDCKHSCHGC